MRRIALIVFAMWAHFAPAGQDNGLSFHSVKVVQTDRETATVTIEYSYGGSVGALFVKAAADAGVDGEINTENSYNASLPPGSHVTTTVKLIRPAYTEATRTDRIAVYAHNGHEYPFHRKVFDQPIEWPAVTKLPTDASPSWSSVVFAFNTGDYNDIDRIVNYWTDSSQFDRDGDWKIDQFYRQLNSRFSHDRPSVLKKIREWRNSQPTSRAGALAEAMYWVQYAEYIQGYVAPGQARDADTLRVVRQYHANAEKILAASKPYASSVPLWYELRLRMAINGGMDEKTVSKRFEDGALAFPKYQTLYIVMARHLVQAGNQPRWSEIMALADRLDATTRLDNPWAYANLISMVNFAVANTIPDLFSTRIASWPRVKESWKQLISRYPSAYNLNRYAAIACQARDSDAFSTALGKMGDRVLPKEWPYNISVDVCKKRFLLNS